MYKGNSALYWFLWVWVALYVLVTVIVYFGVFVNNASPVYTYMGTPSAPGTLTSQRYSFEWSMVIVSVFAHPVFAFCVIGLVMARREQAASIALVTFMGISMMLTLLVVAGLGASYSTCNQNDQATNICNDPNYCCAYRDLPYCAVQLCTTPILPSSLVPNSTFLGIFWTNLSFLVGVQLVFMIVVVVYWSSSPSSPQSVKVKDTPEDILPGVSNTGTRLPGANVFLKKRGPRK